MKKQYTINQLGAGYAALHGGIFAIDAQTGARLGVLAEVVEAEPEDSFEFNDELLCTAFDQMTFDDGVITDDDFDDEYKNDNKQGE